MSSSTSKTVGWDNINLHAVSRENIHSSLAIAAIVAYSLTGICSIHERSAFPGPLGIVLHISMRLQLSKRLSVLLDTSSLYKVTAGRVEQYAQ